MCTCPRHSVWNTNPVSPYWQWMRCVHVPLPIIARLSVTKDLHLEMPNHGVHNLPIKERQQHKHTTAYRADNQVLLFTYSHYCYEHCLCINPHTSSDQTPSACLPVDPPRSFLRLDVDIIVIDIDLGNLHLEVVGQQADGFPHRAKAGTPWRLEQRGRGRRAWRGQKEQWLYYKI